MASVKSSELGRFAFVAGYEERKQYAETMKPFKAMPVANLIASLPTNPFTPINRGSLGQAWETLAHAWDDGWGAADADDPEYKNAQGLYDFRYKRKLETK